MQEVLNFDVYQSKQYNDPYSVAFNIHCSIVYV